MGKYKVEISGIDTRNLKVLTNDEMKALFLSFQNNDLAARDILIEGNLRLVLSILKRFNNRENLDDLFQIGCVGLIKAIDNFDLTYNVCFSTYAVPMILGEIKRYIRDNCSIRISRSIKEIAYKSLRVINEYYAVNGTEPNCSYIADKLGVLEFEVSNALSSLKEPISMYEPIYNDGGDTIYLYDQIEDKKSGMDMSINISLNDAINKLDERGKFILDQRYVIGKTQDEVATILEISQAQVSRLEKKAIKELKKVLN